MRTFTIILLTHLALTIQGFALTYGLFSYTDNGTSTTITDYPEDAIGPVVIPATIDGKPVTSIGSNAFMNCNSVTGISIPDSVLSIGGSAFRRCISLEEITLPDSLTSIGVSAFYDCTSLASINIPDSVNSIGTHAFFNCNSLTGITLPESITAIGMSTFHNCTSLNEVTFGSLLSIIDKHAFRNCVSLTSFTIPNTVTEIGYYAFAGCSSLVSINIPDAVLSIGDSAFRDCSSLVTITIPDSVTTMGDSMFSDCTSMTNVTIGNSVPGLGEFTFYKCSSLTTVSLGNSVSSIGPSAFSGCTSLSTVNTPDSLTSIGPLAFNNCTALTEIILPESVSAIDYFAFYGCISVTSATLPTSITSFGVRVFADCTQLTQLTVPDGVTSVGAKDFSFCTQLTSISLPATTTSIASNAFVGCSKLATIHIEPSNTSLTTNGGVVYSLDMTTLVRCPPAFSGPLTIPASVTTIQPGAFDGCTAIDGVIVELGNTEFRSSARLLLKHDLSALILCPPGFSRNLWISDTVTAIADGALAHCPEVTSIIVDPANPNFSSRDGMLFNKDQTTLIRCPSGITVNIEIPATVTSIHDTALDDLSLVTSITVAAGNTSYASVDGILYTRDLSSIVKCPAGRKGTLTVPDSVTSIGNNALRDCASLTTVSMSASLATIGNFALLGCTGLSSITLPASVTHLGWWSFFNCDNLANITFLGNAPSLQGLGSLYSTTLGDPMIFHFDDAAGFPIANWNGYPTTNMGAETPVKTWLINQDFGYDQDPEADLNGDSVALLTAYALGLDPRQHLAAQMPQPTWTGSALSLEFYTAAPGVTYTVKCSDDLVEWTTTGVTLTTPNPSGLRTATMTIGKSCGFMRLEVTE